MHCLQEMKDVPLKYVMHTYRLECYPLCHSCGLNHVYLKNPAFLPLYQDSYTILKQRLTFYDSETAQTESVCSVKFFLSLPISYVIHTADEIQLLIIQCFPKIKNVAGLIRRICQR